MTKNKFIFLSLLIFFSSLFASFALALEVPIYPTVPGPFPTITASSTVKDYIGYFFGLGIAFAGLIAVLSLVFSGIQLMIGPINPESATNAKDRMKGSILGLILILSSFLIMRTINPVLVKPTLDPLPGVAGVYYTNGSKDTPSPDSEGNIAVNVPTGFNKLKYKCDDPLKAPNLLVWGFTATDFGNYQTATVTRVPCNQTPFDLGPYKSFQTAFETPGIYFFLGSGCTGYASGSTLASGEMGEKFKEKVKSIRIVNNRNLTDPFKTIYYGIIFHENSDITDVSKCTAPLVATTGMSEECLEVPNIKAKSDNIFTKNIEFLSSGDGVTFYNNPFGWDSGARAGQIWIKKEQISPEKTIAAKDLVFDYSKSGVGEAEQLLCQDFSNCQGSIEISGKYIVSTYSKSGYCQVFDQNVENLNSEKSIMNVFGEPIEKIYMVATR